MTYPLAQTVQHRAYTGTVKDSRGNVVDTWADPVDVDVYGWYVPATHEPQIPGHDDRVRVDAAVLAPESFRPGSMDKVVLPIGEFAVEGEVQDYNHGPFGWRPGNVVNLRRVTG